MLQTDTQARFPRLRSIRVILNANLVLQRRKIVELVFRPKGRSRTSNLFGINNCVRSNLKRTGYLLKLADANEKILFSEIARKMGLNIALLYAYFGATEHDSILVTR